MTGGITSVPLPAYWSSKDPEQWRRYPWKRGACANPRCAVNNANYAAVFSEPPAKRRSRPYTSSSRSRSVSAVSLPNTPVELERNLKHEHVVRCGDCDAPLVPLIQSVSRSRTLTPPTPVQVRTVSPVSFPAGLKRNHRIPHYLPSQTREVPPFFHAGNSKWDTSFKASPPSECGDYSCQEIKPSCRIVVRLSADVREEYAREQGPMPPCSLDQASTGATVTESGSPTSPPPRSVDKIQEVEDVLPNFVGISFKATTVELEERPVASQHQTREDDIRLTHFEGNDVGSDSSASPVASEKGLDLSCEVSPIFDGNCVSSFYNALYIPDAKTSDDQQVGLDMRRSPADLRLKLALEIAVFITLVTVLILAYCPSFPSGLRNHLPSYYSCTCTTAATAGATTPGSHLGQLQWLERWAYRGASSVLGCRSPGLVLGSTVFM